MTGEGYRILLSARRRGDVLRAKGFTYDQIADVLALDHQVSRLRLYRFAHGRTVSDVVNAFNDLDPAGAASLRDARLYDYEIHPGAGRKPPVRALTTRPGGTRRRPAIWSATMLRHLRSARPAGAERHRLPPP